MKDYRYDSARVMCACYQFQERKRIYCLGMNPECSCVQEFDSEEDRQDFQEKHCIPPKEHCRCALYPVLYEINS